MGEMTWDIELECFRFRVQLQQGRSESFMLIKGKSTGRPVRSRGKQYKIVGDPGAWYDIQVYVHDDGRIKSVDWMKLSSAPCVSAEASPRPLSIGDTVEIHGLQSAQEWNGRRG